jgi:regulator of nucleoside diphosphate kinase
VLFKKRLTSVQDQNRLINTLAREREAWHTFTPHLDWFHRELRRAHVVPPNEVPEDMITMNSRFALHDPESDETIVYRLAYPEAAAPAQGRISVLSSMGMALFGARVGQEVCWISSAGPEVGTVRRILYQPEAAGHHHL